MAALTPEQISRARSTRHLYLVSFLLVVCTIGLDRLAEGSHVTGSSIQFAAAACELAAIAFGMLMTWRLCRAIGIGVGWAALATALAPGSMMIEMAILLRLYAKRTGTSISFLVWEQRAPGER